MVVFGLGNPGRKYAATRHNLGFMVLDALAAGLGVKFRVRPGLAEARAAVGECSCRLVKPLSYMNRSGAVAASFLKRHPDSLLVVCDDLALPFGRIRIRERGSDGGHQGLADIVARLGTSDFSRVRLGIGAAPAGKDAADYVLARFLPDERRKLPALVEAGRDAVIMVLEQGIARAMNEFNRRVLVPGPDAKPKPTTD